MVDNYYDEDAPVSSPEPTPTVQQDPFFQALNARFATTQDAQELAELFASVSYTVGEVATVTTGAYQGSGPAWGGIGEDFMFAVNMYMAFQDMQNYHAPDQSVMAALDAAGVNYSVGANGSIHAPGYGYAVASDTGYTPASSVDYGTSQYESGGYSNTVLIVGQPTQSTLFGVPMFGEETIVVTGEVRQAQGVGGFLRDLGKEILGEILGGEFERWLNEEPDTTRQQVRDRLNQMESNVSNKFDPSQPHSVLTMPMKDGSVVTGFLQSGKFFADMRGPNGGPNGVLDIIWTQSPTTGQFYTNWGNGWVPTGNPFTVSGF